MSYYTDEDYLKARRRVKVKKGFYYHFATYCICIIFLFIINILTDPFDFWFQYPMASWGVAIAFHYIGVFGIPGFNHRDDNWEEKAIQKELDKIKKAPPTVPHDELELKEFKKLRKEWDDSDFV